MIPRDLLRHLTAGLERWVFLSVVLAAAFCALLTWQHWELRTTLGDLAQRLGDVRRARLDLASGFLHLSLASSDPSPFSQQDGVVLLGQAVQSFSRAFGTGSADRADLDQFNQRAGLFLDQLRRWSDGAANSGRDIVALRITYAALDREARKVDELLQRRVESLAARTDRSFLIAMGGAVSALGVIISIVLLAVREQRRIQARLETERTRLRTLIHAIPDLIWLKDLDGRFIACNRTVETVVGRREDDIIGRTDDDFLLAAQAAALQGHDREAIAAGGPVISEEWIDAPADKRRILLEIINTPIADMAGAVVAVLGIGRDITRRRIAEEQLHKLSQAIEQSPVGIVITDSLGRAEYVNETFLKTNGLERDEAIGQEGLVLPDQALTPGQRRDFQDHLAQGRVWKGECANRTRTGRDYIAFAIVSPIRQPDGTITHFAAVIEDVTEKRRLVEELDRHRHHLEDLVAQRTAQLAEAKAAAEAANHAKSRFVTNISHEIRTPLNALLGLAQIGLRDSAGQKAEAYFFQIRDAGQALLGVIEDILDFARIESGKMRVESVPVDLGAVIDRAVSLVVLRAQEKGLAMTVEEIDPLPEGWRGDPQRLQQVLVNLLANAVKFTPAGGRVTLVVEVAAGRLVMRIMDTGIGIAAEATDRLFEPFEQADSSTIRDYGGTGLGLPISRYLTEAMGGTIAVTSVRGHGSTFTLSFPFSLPPVQPRHPASGHLVLFGLMAEEIMRLTQVWPDCRMVSSLDQAGEGRGMILLSASALTDEVCRQVAVLAARGRRIGLVVSPGHGGLPPPLREIEVCLLERPLRPRHVRAALLATGEDPDIALLPARLGGVRLIAAEDNPVNRLVLEEMLRNEDADIRVFESAPALLRHLAEAGSECADLVITDIQMPEMDGYTLARTLRERYPTLPVIGLTAHAMPEELQRCLDAGMVERVTKPVDLDELVDTIARHVVIRPADAAGPAQAGRPARLVDAAELEALYGGRRPFIARLVATVLSAHRHAAADLRVAAANDDHARIAELAHAIEATATTLSAREVRGQAQQVERAARAGEAMAAVMARGLATTVDAMLDELADTGRRL